MPQGNSQLTSYVITGAVVVLVLALRFRRLGQSRPLQLERLWVLPVVYGVIAVALVAQSPLQGIDWAWCAVALAIGAAIGWYRGKSVKVTVDPNTRALNQTQSAATMVFLVALILVRFGLRSVLATEAQSWHVSAAVIVDAFIALALGLIAVTRLEIFLRARKLLETARAQGER
ncbi:MAG: CcdC protein domain-containing protein [Devosia sp.]